VGGREAAEDAPIARGYGQYCPLDLAAELLAERWTILVIRRLLDGCCHFNAIQRGVPRISPSLHSKRLTELQRAGIVEKARKLGEPNAKVGSRGALARTGSAGSHTGSSGRRTTLRRFIMRYGPAVQAASTSGCVDENEPGSVSGVKLV
jgi:DNA-binding HxlR family transcriptional regulator